ncbi:uncharacterized protein [Branchiostoma lanceolatum]|uniref:uncharacterized protein n=1 Tax=Branchiostoma lanceolatum TaxID=7740 RepID=UPI003455A6F5
MATAVRLPARSGAEFAEKEFPFNNLVLEGGGAKGIAYIGAAKILEDAGIMKNITRFGGTSAGAITAALLAVGMTSEEMMTTLSGVNLWDVLMDGGGYRWIPWLDYISYGRNLIYNKGANPGNEFLKWFGDVIGEQVKKHGLDEDVTFLEVNKVLDVELCIVAYNVQYARELYFHVKTTPLMRVREAVRMSMSIPVAFEPYERGGFLHIDGGLVANYPVYCFDGWWLSLSPEDTFQAKFDEKTETEVKTLMSPENLRDKRFSPVENSNGGEKTLGLILFSEDTDPSPHEADLEARLRRLEEEDPTARKCRPATDLACTYEKDHAARVEFNREERKRFMGYGEGLIRIERVYQSSTPDTLEENFMKEFNEEDFKPWGWTKAEAFAAYFPQVERGKEPSDEVLKHLQDNWLVLEAKTLSLGEKKVKTSVQYYSSLLDFMGKNEPFEKEDVKRTIGIDVDYVGTMDFAMANDDMNFLMDVSWNRYLLLDSFAGLLGGGGGADVYLLGEC